MMPHGGNIEDIQKQFSRPGIVDFSVSQNHCGLDPDARSWIERDFEKLALYPDPLSKDLRRAYSEKIGVEFSKVVPGNGATDLIYEIVRFARPQKALIVEPTFTEYRKALTAQGARIRTMTLDPADNFEIPFGRFSANAEGADMVFFCNPSNPVGKLYPREQLLKMAEFCEASGADFVVDEALMDFCGNAETLTGEVAGHPRLIVIRSMTKFYCMSGLRLGFLVMDELRARELWEIRPPWMINRAAEIVAPNALASPWYLGTDEEARNLRRKLAERIAEIEWLKPVPGDANCLTVEILAEAFRSRELKYRLITKSVLIRDCMDFKGLGPKFFRVAARKAEDNEILLRALRST